VNPGDAVEQFARRVERQRIEVLVTFAARPSDPAAHERARMHAKRVAADTGREDRVASVRTHAERWVLSLYDASNRQPGFSEVNVGRPGTVADRVRLANSLADAFTAVALRDALPDDVADELIGPWVQLAGPA